MEKEFKYTGQFTLTISKEEFEAYAISKVNDNELKEEIEMELYQSWSGIVDGDFGGAYINWKRFFFIELFRKNIIEQTELSIAIYGKFQK